MPEKRKTFVRQQGVQSDKEKIVMRRMPDQAKREAEKILNKKS